MKKISIYEKENLLDRAWFDSSNVLYGECQDKKNDYKTVKIVFKNGAQYLYLGVNVNDWLMFREAESQGKALNSYISKKDPVTKKPIYEYRRLEDIDVNEIESEYQKVINAQEKPIEIDKEGFYDLAKNVIKDDELVSFYDKIEKYAIANKKNIIIKIKYQNE